MRQLALAIFSIIFSFLAHAASIEKANTLRTNGLLHEAKRELIDVTFSDSSTQAEKAEALLILGDIGIDEGKRDVAVENWSRVVSEFRDEPAAAVAKGKLELAQKIAPLGNSVPSEESYASGTILVVGPSEYSWSIPQIAGALGPAAVPFEGSVVDAVAKAKANSAITAIAEISLSVDTAFESGRVVCLLPSGKKVWEEKVMFNLGGGAERVARRFVDNLSEKVAKRKCPVSRKQTNR